MSKSYESFRRHVRYGNYNLALQHLSEHWEEVFYCERATALEWLHHEMSCGMHLSAETRQQIQGVIHEKALVRYGLSSMLTNSACSVQKSQEVGRALCLCATKEEGYVRDIQVFETSSPRKDRQTILDPIGRELFRAIERKFAVVLLWDPTRYDFSIVDPCGREDATVKGDSMGLSLALALCSCLIEQPLPTSLASTAAVLPGGLLGSVTGLRQKLTAVKREKDYISQVIVSSTQAGLPEMADGVIPVESLEDVLSQIWPTTESVPLFVRATLDLDAELQRIDRLYDAYLIDSCLENASRLISYLESARVGKDRKIKALFTGYWRRASCLTHKGQARLAEEDLKRAKDLYEKHKSVSGTGPIPSVEYFKMRNTYGVLLKDLFLYKRAEQEHRSIDKKIRSIGGTNQERGMNLSSWSQLLLAQGRFEEAEILQKQAIELVIDEDKHRNTNYLAQIYVASGNYDKAEEALGKSKELLKIQPEKMARNFPFIHMTEVALHCRLGQCEKTIKKKQRHWDRIHEIVEIYPDPQAWWLPALIHKYAAIALLEEGREIAGLEGMEKIIYYFEQQSDIVLRILGAAVRCERAKYWLNKRDLESAASDLKSILNVLSEQKNVKAFFREELTEGKRMLRLIRSGSLGPAQAITLLDSLIKKIPD